MTRCGARGTDAGASAASSSSTAWRRAASPPSSPDSIRASSATRPSPSTIVAVAVVRRPRPSFDDGDLRRRLGRDLGEVGDDEHLVACARPRPAPGRRRSPRCRRCRRRPRRTRASAASSSVAGEHEAQGQHRPGQLAARGDLGERQQRRARGWRRAGTGRGRRPDRRRVADLDVDRGVGHRQLAQPCRRPPPPRAAPPRPAGAADGLGRPSLGRRRVRVARRRAPRPAPRSASSSASRRAASSP